MPYFLPLLYSWVKGWDIYTYIIIVDLNHILTFAGLITDHSSLYQGHPLDTWPWVNYGRDYDCSCVNYSQAKIKGFHKTFAVFKENLSNHFEVLNLTDKKLDELQNAIKVFKDKYEKKLPSTKKQKKANWTSEEMVEIAKNRRKTKSPKG